MTKAKETRYIFVRDDGKTRTGFTSYADAVAAKAGIPETPEQTVRVRLRRRTNTWDVVVKVRREVHADGA